MPMTMKPNSMPSEMMKAAEEADVAFDGVIPNPEKPFNPKTVTSLAKAVADVATKMFGMRDVKSESYSGPVEAIDPKLSQLILMIAEAARDYGSPLPVEPTQIKSDSDLVAITAHLAGLSTDREFKDFLSSESMEDTEESEMGEEEPEDDRQMMFDFASRMRRTR